MSQRTRKRLDDFWELMDELLNIVLFLLVGLELLVITLNPWAGALGAAAIPLVLLVRFLAVGGVITALAPIRDFDRGAVRLLTWGGLRGGISVALALSLPAGEAREIIVTMTYVVVVFSIIVQGLTLAPLVKRLGAGMSRPT
jgi:CPA1 family monovalent cation:H+ antiporter